MKTPKQPRRWEDCHWVTIAQVMAYLGVCRDKVTEMIHAGQLTAYRGAGLIRFKRIEVDMLLTDGTPRLGRKAI